MRKIDQMKLADRYLSMAKAEMVAELDDALGGAAPSIVEKLEKLIRATVVHQWTHANSGLA
jgi:hypothetical protein